MPEANAPREEDLALVNALQLRPRASWAELAPVLQATPATLARRWQRLTRDRLARVVVTPGPAFGTVGITGLVSVDSDPAVIDAVVDTAAANPRVATVQVLGGNPDLLLTCFARDIATLHACVLNPLRRVPGVRAITLSLSTSLRLEGSRWRLGALDPAQVFRLTDGDSEALRSGQAFDEPNRALVQYLAVDGRASLAALSEAIGASTTTVRRRLGQLTRSGILRFRCDVAATVFGWPVAATLWVRAPATMHSQVAQAIVGRPEVRAVMSTTGGSNLLIQVMLRSIEGLAQLELDLLNVTSAVEVVNTAFDLRTAKQMGWHLDSFGRGTHATPVQLW